ncbi:hypothetical protein HQ529_00040 [Candidatus Woesearchaeota archaeon]|nr:hypothetical protein [Candidatus Woesearchaeota archaeon]
MADESVFRGAIEFFNDIGIYDVVLPFLLIFTIVFAILEKTKVLGTEEIDGKNYTKKNLNAMVSFVLAFLVIASTKLVSLVNQAMANITIIILVSVSFLLLIGSFYREDEDVFLTGGWRTTFMVLVFIAIILIFLNAIQLDSGQSWLVYFWEWISDNWGTNWAASIIMLIIVVFFMFIVVKEWGPPKHRKGWTGPKQEKQE